MSEKRINQLIGLYKGRECHKKVKYYLLDEMLNLIPALTQKNIWQWFTKKYADNIVEAAKKLNEVLWYKEEFDEECMESGCAYSEEEMYELQGIIKEKRKAKAILETRLDDAENDQQAIRIKVDALKAGIRDHEDRLKMQNEFFNKQVKSIEIAELEAILKKRIRQADGCIKIRKIWTGVTAFLLAISYLLIFAANLILEEKLPWPYFTGVFSLLYGLVLTNAYRTVGQSREMNVNFLGEYVTTWEAGLHFLLLFFMRADSIIYTGTKAETLYLDERKIGDGNNKMSAKVDFANGAAEVIVELFFRIFDTFQATYIIENVIKSVKEKMEAGIRAYYGQMPLDRAIEERAETHLRKIILQGATEAGKFKEWGCAIESLAVTDIKLPADLEEKRNEVLLADKDLEISRITRERAAVEAETAKIVGHGKGDGVYSFAAAAGINPGAAAQFLLSEQRFDAWRKSGMLIASDSKGAGDASLTGAVAGIAAAIGANTAKPKVEPDKVELDADKSELAKPIAKPSPKGKKKKRGGKQK